MARSCASQCDKHTNEQIAPPPERAPQGLYQPLRVAPERPHEGRPCGCPETHNESEGRDQATAALSEPGKRTEPPRAAGYRKRQHHSRVGGRETMRFWLEPKWPRHVLMNGVKSEATPSGPLTHHDCLNFFHRIINIPPRARPPSA